ncbi:methyltransferase [Methylorubrum salsuginis]|uniref:Demethylspheroidene O-methyltransferase n=1 Tax=Methylorubrum salsuginis TaxID=414703 RepID=A0A1I4IDD7_9HYPH|nr:methyltransferase [Methylorubrum salsuginis]SFL52284.1 demethylspheroidene O-methyltransferase [Methylorubrum salsuginis]
MPAATTQSERPAAAPVRRGWRERWLAFRNGTVASPAFQRWAAGFPLTRGIARRNTRALFDLCAGFVYAQVLFACVRLDLFRLLQPGPLAPEVIARRLDLPPERALTLLKAAASLDLLTRLPDGRFGLADLGAAMIGNPSIAAMVEHHSMLYADLADPVALLRDKPDRTRLSAYWPYAGGGAEVAADSVAAYSGLMAASQAMIAGDVLDALLLSDRACLMDIGGGEGVFLFEAARRHPHLTLKLLDLPPVAERARARFESAGFGSRVTCHGGSFREGILPNGADAISLVRVVHDHDDSVVEPLLRAVHAALPPGGLVAIAEPMAGTSGAEPIGDAYFGFYLMAMGSGRPRTAAELSAMLLEAGFTDIRERPTRRPLLAKLITAKRT